jgi:putative ABC transport system permease protein
MQYTNYDIEVNLDRAIPAAAPVQAAETVPGVVRAEGWIATNASLIRPDGTQNSNIWMVSAPAASDLLRPTLVDGRWPQPGDGFVVNVDFQSGESAVELGEPITLVVEGHELTWPVVGIVTSQLMGPVAYAPYESLSVAIDLAGDANRIVIATERHDASAQEDAADLVAQRLRDDGYPVVQAETQYDLRQGTEGLFQIMVVLLFLVGGLLVVVGGLGLAGAMSLNVIERTRELGVMRAIGASNRAIAQIVIVEGLVVGLLGWLLGTILAVPLSWAMSYALGEALTQIPLSYVFSPIGPLLWLALVAILSIVASIVPARRAMRLSVREVLSYE